MNASVQEAYERMQGFIRRENVAHFCQRLASETDTIKRRMLIRLLAEERETLASSGNMREEAASALIPSHGQEPALLQITV
jgi:hypothetical protein